MDKGKRFLAHILAGGVMLLSSCHPVYMTAEDRLQEDYQEVKEDVELETLADLHAYSYSNVSIIPYQIETLAEGFTELSEEEIRSLKKVDNYGQQSLRNQTEGEERELSISYGNGQFYYYGLSHDDCMKYYAMLIPREGNRLLTFAELAGRFPEEEIEGLSRKKAEELCSLAVETAGISAAFENIFAMDSETMNRLKEGAEKEGNEGLYAAPGSKYIVDESGSPGVGTWDVKPWTKEQEAYLVVYRILLDGKILDSTGYQCTLRIICRADGQIVYAYCSGPMLDLSQADSRELEIVSSSEAYSLGKEILRKKGLEQSEISSVKQCYGYKSIDYLAGEPATVAPCWEVCYITDVTGRKVRDYLYLDAVTGLEADANVY